MSDISIKNLSEFNGTGTVRFDNSEATSVRFVLFFLYNGKITGNVEFNSPPDSLYDYLKKMKEFKLEGVVTSSNQKIVAEHCVLDSLSTFNSRNVLISAESLKRRPTRDLLIEFGLVNVYKTFRVVVETNVGTIYLSHHQNIEELNRLMLLYHIPLITSVAKLQIKTDGSRNLEEILDNVTIVIEDFLKITSFSQSVWHDWSYVRIIEQLANSDRGQVIFQRFRCPKSKVPALRQLTNDAYSAEFIKSAWKGYSRELDEKYGFTFALEWYIESNLVDAVEFKVLNASTCFELLLDKFTSQHGSESIMDDKTFEHFQKWLKKQARKELKELDQDSKTRNLVYQNLGGINRRSYVDKAYDLLEHWGISIDDAETDFEGIVKVRDEITHRGKYYPQGNDPEYRSVFKAYRSLALILPRIFLAMLRYKGLYWDSITDRWIQFSSVCTRGN